MLKIANQSVTQKIEIPQKYTVKSLYTHVITLPNENRSNKETKHHLLGVSKGITQSNLGSRQKFEPWHNKTQQNQCSEPRLRSAWASALSDQNLHCIQWVTKETSFLHANREDPGPEVIQLFACSTQLSTKFKLLIKTMMLKINTFHAFRLSDDVFIMLINVKMPTIVGILTFMSRINFVLS